MTIIKSTTIPHNYRNRFLKNSGSSTVTNNENNSTSGGGHADLADLATLSNEAKNLTVDSTDWNKIARKDIAQSILAAWTFSEGFTSTKKAWFNNGIEVTGDTKTSTLTTTGTATIGGGCIVTGNITSGGNIAASGRLSGASLLVSGEARAATMIADIFKTPEFSAAVGMIGLGFGITKDNNGIATLQTDNLLVLGRMIVNSLNIREVSYIGGTYILTPAASTVYKVQPLYTKISFNADTKQWTTNINLAYDDTVVGYRVLWAADDGSIGTMNYWRQGDMAFCQTFNITQPGDYTNVSNQYYKRLVCREGTVNIVESGEQKKYHYADLANISNVLLFDSNGNAIVPLVQTSTTYPNMFVGLPNPNYNTEPKAEDKLVCLGSQADATRQGCIQITAEGEASLGIYDNIGDFRALTNYEIHYMSKTAVRMRSDKFWWRSSDGVTLKTQANFEIAVGNAGLDITNEEINLIAGKVNFKVGNQASTKISIDPATGTLNAVDGNFVNGNFSGTVKANNLFRSVALTCGENNRGNIGFTSVFESTNVSNKWIGFFSDTTAGGQSFHAGEYYRLSDLSQTVQDELLDTGGSGDIPFDHWDFCTGPADEIMVVDDHYSPRSSSPYVILPRCQDFVGKMVTIRHERNQVSYTAKIIQIDYFKGPLSPAAHFVESIGIDASGDLYLDTSNEKAMIEVNHGSTITLYSVGTYWIVIDEK